jgi:hypothetical protein
MSVQGQHARAQQALDAAREQPVAPPLRTRVSQLEGRLLLALGQPGWEAAFERAQAEAPLAGRTLLQSLVALDHSCTLAPTAALATCEEVLLRCSTVGYAGAALTARLRSASFSLEAGDVERALGHARAVLEVPADVVADDFYPAERWWILSRVFEAAGLATPHQEAIAAGREWVQQTARSRVGETFRDSFLRRNRVNRELLAAAARLGLG